MTNRTIAAALAAWIAVLIAAPLRARPAPPPTVAHVDLDRYLGTWYEIARLPNRFQRDCAGFTTAHYARLPNGRIEVVNSCLRKDGSMKTARGVARVADPSNAKLEVSFVKVFGFHVFWSDYWVLGLGQEYRYSIVGSPDRRFGWVLSRTPTLSPDLQAEIDRRLIQLRYDPGQFKETRQAPARTGETHGPG